MKDGASGWPGNYGGSGGPLFVEGDYGGLVTGKTIRILLVDDHPMLRAGLAATIKPEPDMAVVATAANGKEAVEQYRLHLPDVTLMDLKMPEMGGVDAIRAIRAEFSAARIMVLTTYEGEEDIYRAMKAGAVSYLLKDTAAEI